MKKLILLFLLIGSLATAQDIPVGSWRSHLTYHDTKTVAIAGSKVYAASSNGLFYLDQTDNSINLLNTLNGLSDTGIADLVYHPLLERLLVVYRNGNLDVIEEDLITNVRTILNASSISGKQMFQAVRNGNLVYIAASFGVVVFDLSTLRVKETYANLGPTGERIAVTDIAVFQDTLFAASAEGLISGAISPAVNLIDFQNWRNRGFSGKQINHLAATTEALFVPVNAEGVFKYQNGSFSEVPFSGNPQFLLAQAFADQLIIGVPEQLFSYRPLAGFELLTTVGGVQSPLEAAKSDDNTIWIADQKKGLLRLANPTVDSYFPDGPYNPAVQRMAVAEGKIVALAGEVDKKGNKGNNTKGYYFWENGAWANFTPEENYIGAAQLPAVTDLTSVAYQLSSNTYYFSSFGQGLLSWSATDNKFKVQAGTPFLQTNRGTLVSAVAADYDDQIWVATFGVAAGQPSVHILNREGNWQSLTFNRQESREILQLLVDDFQQGWAVVAESSDNKGKGIYVFDAEGRERLITTGPNKGDLPVDDVNCLALDRTGSIWVGTDDGVTEFFDPGRILTANASDAAPPRFENRPLLDETQVNALAVDGGNRKWIGTNSGAWLFSADGSTLIHHFTTANSPLLSDVVKTISVQPQSGEVFFGTDAGIISYRSDATEATFAHQNVKVFPNPVQPRYQGVLTIAGLTRDGTVKITDISGKKIREVRANGGTATWNLADYNGRRATTGVYLIFSSSSDGEETYIGKVAVVE